MSSSHQQWRKDAEAIVSGETYDFQKYQEYDNQLEMSYKYEHPPSLGWHVASTYVGRFRKVHEQRLAEMSGKSPRKSPSKSPRKSPSKRSSPESARDLHAELKLAASRKVATVAYTFQQYEECLRTQTPRYDGPPNEEWYIDHEYCLKFIKHYKRDLDKKMKTFEAFVARSS
jgi:hypothetical protein